MSTDEITAEMNKYTIALQKEKDLAIANKVNEETGEIDPSVFEAAKKNAHKVAIECLNKILTPELKVFIKNLCFNKLGYPDEPVFYKVFGEYPKVGDKVNAASINEKDLQSFTNYIDDPWFMEGTYISSEVNGDKTFFVLEDLPETDEELPEEMRERLRNISDLKKFINEKANSSEKKKMLSIFDQLIPMLGNIRI